MCGNQLKKQELKEKIENEVGELVQFLLDEKDELLASLDTEEYTYVSVIEENLKEVEREMAAVDVAISEIQHSLSEGSSFEVRFSASHRISNPSMSSVTFAYILNFRMLIVLTSFL